MHWPVERRERVVELRAKGLSSSQIAKEFGCTRNAIIGLLHRMGIISPRDASKSQKDAAAAKEINRCRRAKPSPPPALETLTVDIDVEVSVTVTLEEGEPEATELSPDRLQGTLTLMQLNAHTCHWPYDSGLYCGLESEPDKPYCLEHCRRAYVQPQSHRPRPYYPGAAQRRRRAHRAAIVGRDR